VELWREDAANSHPQKGWAAVEEGEHGMAVLSRGLPEYEVLAAEGGVASSADGTGVGAAGGNAIAVTLLRSVDHVHSRDSLTIDRRAWGIPFRVPLAQCEGRHGFSLAVRPYAGDWAGAAVDHAGERFSTGYRAHALPAAAADVRLGQPLLGSVEPEGVILSALKPAEDGDGVIVRLWNNRDVGREARLELAPEVTRLTRCDLAESPLRDGSGEGHVENGVLGSEPSISDTSNTADGYRTTFFSIGPWEIVTLRLELAGE
jgi:alpha-mannosidase